MTTTVKIEYRPAPALDRILHALPAEETRKRLETEGAKNTAVTVRRYLEALAGFRHATAHALGATPTQVIGRTAQGVKAEERNGAQCVVVPHKLFRRAFQDVQIAPDRKEALAIPKHRLAYGRAPASWPRERFFIWRRKKGSGGPDDKGAAFLARSEGTRPKKLVLYYLLYRGRILQKRDETLLPSGNTLALSARAGISKCLASLFLARKKGPTT